MLSILVKSKFKKLQNIVILRLSKMNVFDTKAKVKQRNRASLWPESENYEYLYEEMAYRMADRIYDIKRCFNVAVDFGCGRGFLSKHLTSDYVRYLIQCDTCENDLRGSDEENLDVANSKILLEPETFPFKENSIDLVVSSLSMHWINNLPGIMKQINNALKPDGCFLGVLFGGETLYQLRSAFYLADNERIGGFGPHVSPFVDSRDLGGLLNSSGFNLLTIDMDEITVHFPSVFELMHDLRGMGNSNCTWSRVNHLSKDVMFAVAAIYDEMYSISTSDSTESSNIPEKCREMSRPIPATFQLLHFIAWKPHPSQQKPAKRGSATVSFKDLGKVTTESP